LFCLEAGMTGAHSLWLAVAAGALITVVWWGGFLFLLLRALIAYTLRFLTGAQQWATKPAEEGRCAD
jgi:hypothetical protein